MTEVKLKLNEPFNLDATLDCGQAFRWFRENGIWTGVLKEGIYSVEKENDFLKIEYSSRDTEKERGFHRDYLKKYFNVKFDYDEFEKMILKKSGKFRELFQEILNFSRGLRILNQQPFEVLISYILSIQSSIPLIKKRIKKISALFPENLHHFKGKDYYHFPTFEQFKKITDKEYKELRLGYREKYFRRLTEEFDGEDFCVKLKSKSTEEKLERLKTIYGVGDKVGCCIMLFSLEDYSAVPVDIWIERFFQRYALELKDEFYERFKPFAGVLQEYIYRWIRNEKN